MRTLCRVCKQRTGLCTSMHTMPWMHEGRVSGWDVTYLTSQMASPIHQGVKVAGGTMASSQTCNLTRGGGVW